MFSLAGVFVALGLAFHSNRIARDTAMRQLRAYLTVETIEVKDFSEDGKEKQWIMYVQWKNTGQTPATSVTGGLTFAHFAPRIPSDFPFLKYQPKPEPHSMIVGPDQLTLTTQVPPDADKLINEAADGKWKLYLWGFVEYDTIFKRPRQRTELCVEIATSRVNGKLSFSPHPIGPHNGMDESAMKRLS
jgi:hypothetical protein